MRVQEMLQVENVFNLQVLGEDKDTQLNLTWRTLDEKKNEEDYCEECGTRDLRKMIGGLVEKLLGVKPIVVRKKKGILFRDTPFSKFVEGGKKWFKTGDEKTQIKFEGDIVNGIPNGQGTSTSIEGYKYVGGFKDGLRNGQGTETLPDGRKYVGEFSGRRNGQGTMFFPNRGNYVGEWKNGKPNGQGTMFLHNGSRYEGEWKDGKPWNGTGYKDGKIISKYVNGVKQ
jgi:hypothetical protein